MNTSKLLLSALVFTASGCSAAVSTPAPADDTTRELKMNTEKVIVFKDGYCLVIKRAKGRTDKHGIFHTHEVPDAAVLGSFWATPKAGRMVSMTAGWAETSATEEKEVPCSQNIEILKANLGKPCTITIGKQTFTGTIQHILPGPAPAQHRPSQLHSSHINISTTSSSFSGQFILRTAEGDQLFPISAVNSIRIKEMKTTHLRSTTKKARQKQLTFKMDAANQDYEMLIMYFRPGVRWIPTYRVDLNPDPKKKTARISMQAEIINEAEDLIGMPMDIVVGVPNFRFKSHPSPLVLEHVLRNSLRQAAPQLGNQFRNDFSNALYSQRSGDFRRNAAQANAVQNGSSVKLPGDLTAAGTQDLFVYNLPTLSLKKGERVAVPIMQTTVPYRDVYTWDVHVKHPDYYARRTAKQTSPLKLSKNEVWHQIELENNTAIPWTTGAAMIMQGQQPLAQELLTYTSPKDHCRVPVTVSVDARGSVSEQETKRVPNALRWAGHTYFQIFQQAKLHLCNNKNRNIPLEITFRFGGRADKVSHKGKSTLHPYSGADWLRYHGHPSVNNSSVVRWKTNLKPGETFEPKVDYHFFTRY